MSLKVFGEAMEQGLEPAIEHLPATGLLPASDKSRPLKAANEPPGLLSSAEDATALAQAPAEPTQAGQEQQQQQAASLTEHEGAAEVVELDQKREASAGGRKFTAEQQAVAAALMVVLKRAMKGGKEAAIAAKQVLVSNNVTTRHLLAMLPDEGQLPTMQQVQQEASAELLESLTKLARLCEAARCQPLEVFTRSVHCTTHSAALESIKAKGRVYEQQRMQRSKATMARHNARLQSMPTLQKAFDDLQQLGVQLNTARLPVVMTFLHVLRMLHRDVAMLHRSDLEHMLPGKLKRSSPLAVGRQRSAACLDHMPVSCQGQGVLSALTTSQDAAFADFCAHGALQGKSHRRHL